MKNLLKTFLIFNVLCAVAFSQNSIALKPNFGLYAYNSENSLKIMGDKNFITNYGFAVNYDRENFFGYKVRAEYSFFYSKADNTLEFRTTEETEPSRIYYSDVSLYGHNVDLSFKGNLFEWLSLGGGPSAAIINRSVEVELNELYGAVLDDLEDRLASLCLGLNGYLEIRKPLSNEPQHFFFTAGFTVRYLHSFWFDEKGRKLDDYSQNYLTTIFSAGFGYNF